MTTAISQRRDSVPAHVPAHLVYEFDFYTAPELRDAPQRDVAKLLHQHAPDIFYTTRNGGHWVATRAADAVEMFRDPERFSSDPEFNYNKQVGTRHAPLMYDPPEHTDFRRILNPFFTPGAIAAMEPGIRALAIELIDGVLAEGGCEFVHDIAQTFPVRIFLQLVNAPESDREALIDYANRYLRSPDMPSRIAALRGLGTYLEAMLDARRANLGDDIMSRLLTAQVLGRPLTADELRGAAILVFLAGLDTVAALLSHTQRYLATHPDQYRRLVASPALIGNALEEMIRTHGVVVTERGARHDTEYKGLTFLRGDRIVFLTPLYGMDANEMDNPFEVDFEREVSRHLVFGSGPHRCIGSHLARTEIRVFLEEWTRRIPAFSEKPGASVVNSGGIVWIPDTLELVWNTAEVSA